MQISLRRVTSSQAYLPFIDGLRFFCILSVVLVHYLDFYDAHTYPVRKEPAFIQFHLEPFFGSSDNAVLFFFAISGFILGMPFAKSLLFKEPYPDLRGFYIRRLTRLEPPYLLILTGLLFLNVFWIHRDTFVNTFPHYLASFFYVHNIIYDSYPTLNFVFWSLEIEVQFYLVAPLLAQIFRLEVFKRRAVLVAGICLFSSMNFYFATPFLSLVNYLQYFLAGFLALDLFLNYSPQNSILFDGLCLALAILIFTGILTAGIVLPFLICLLIFFSPLSVFWKNFLSLKWISITGGMCYTIYMLHHPAMAVFLNRFVKNQVFGGSLWFDFGTRLVLTLVIVFLISAVYFIFVERPCMQKNWYRNLIRTKKTLPQ